MMCKSNGADPAELGISINCFRKRGGGLKQKKKENRAKRKKRKRHKDGGVGWMERTLVTPPTSRFVDATQLLRK
jgi:hypothetical protein